MLKRIWNSLTEDWRYKLGYTLTMFGFMVFVYWVVPPVGPEDFWKPFIFAGSFWLVVSLLQ